MVTDSEGTSTLRPNNKVIDKKEIEVYRASLKREPTAKVLLTFEEIGE